MLELEVGLFKIFKYSIAKSSIFCLFVSPPPKKRRNSGFRVKLQQRRVRLRVSRGGVRLRLIAEGGRLRVTAGGGGRVRLEVQ